jgi:hypothetical protein
MSDRSVEREIEANEQRADDAERDDDGSVVDTVEQAVNPLTRGLDTRVGGDNDDDSDLDPDRERRLNDADQRPN